MLCSISRLRILTLSWPDRCNSMFPLHFQKWWCSLMQCNFREASLSFSPPRSYSLHRFVFGNLPFIGWLSNFIRNTGSFNNVCVSLLCTVPTPTCNCSAAGCTRLDGCTSWWQGLGEEDDDNKKNWFSRRIGLFPSNRVALILIWSKA